MRLGWHIQLAVRCVLAAVIALGLAAPLARMAFASLPVAHASVTAPSADHGDAGHWHASEDADGPGHRHDHSGGDHIHEAATPAEQVVPSIHLTTLRRERPMAEGVPSDRGSGLDRPPRG
ncbi:MAG: hypothetical protein DI532_12385 [Azospirillum brasilense]|nr:MAG: hypothetical protein DI532_12385 [Azospirillum brasilense]